MLSSDAAPHFPSATGALPDALAQGRVINRNPLGTTTRALVAMAAPATNIAVQRLASHAALSGTDPEANATLFAGLEGKRVDGLPMLLRVARAESGLAFLLESLEGEPLDQFIATRTGPIDVEQGVAIVAQLAGALASMHAAQLLHLDVRPSAITFDEASGRASFTDLGLACPYGNVAAAAVALPGRGLDDLPYASAEMLAHAAPHPSDDVYSLACVAYELLTGMHPYARRSAIEAADGTIQPSIIAGLCDRQNEALLGALVPKRSARSITMAALARAFSPQDDWRDRLRRRAAKVPRRKALVGTAACALFVLGALTQWLVGQTVTITTSTAARESRALSPSFDTREPPPSVRADSDLPVSPIESVGSVLPEEPRARDPAAKTRVSRRAADAVPASSKGGAVESVQGEAASRPGGNGQIANAATRGLATYACPSCSCVDLRAKRFLDGQSLTFEEANYYLNVCAATG